MAADPAPRARQRVLDVSASEGASLPFGLRTTKPKHFREMFKVAWRNRDNLAYSWKVLTRGVCDGCALGVAGLHDWTIDGYHLCLTRLNLLRLNTMPEAEPRQFEDLEKLAERLRAERPKDVRSWPTGPAPSPTPHHAIEGELDEDFSDGVYGGTWDNAQLRELGRLAYPMLRRRGDPGFRRISWEDAVGRIAARIRACDPKRLAFFITARGVTNEVYYMSQKVARFLGTNHVDNAARLCHAPSTGAMKYALGYAASTCSYRDWYGTDLVVFFGANPANDQPVTTKYLHEAKTFGTKIVLVNPLLEPGMRRYWVPSTPSSAVFGTAITDWWFPVRQGGDIAFLYGTLKILLEKGWLRDDFIRSSTHGWDELKQHLGNLDLAKLETEAGLTREDFTEFAELLHRAKNAVLVWSMGITQHSMGGDGVSMVLNLGLAMGYVGRPKNGLMPIRGHSSVQGGGEMGCYATALPGGKALNASNAAELSAQYGFPVPAWNGMTAVEMVDACGRGDLDVFYCVGGNFLRTLPDPEHVAEAMRKVPLRVHQDIIFTDQMFIEPSDEVLLLPAKTRYEQDDGGIETSTERRVMFSPEIPRQVGEARAEWKILRDVAAAAWPERAATLGCETGQAMREEIARVIPFYDGVQHFRRTGDAIQWGGERLCEGGRFATHDGKGHFKRIDLPEHATRGLAAPADSSKSRAAGAPLFHVSTRRGKQFNTLIYAEIDPLTGASRDAVFMNPDDAAELQLARGDRVVLVNEMGRFEGSVFPVLLPRGNLQVHWPEGNHLIRRGVVDETAGVPDYNAYVHLERP